MQQASWNHEAGIFAIDSARQQVPFAMPDSHLHDWYELYYLVQGERDYFIRDRTFHLAAGSMAAIPPNELHRSLGNHVRQWERILISFRPGFLAGSSADHAALLALFHQENPCLQASGKDRARIETILADMLQEASSQAASFPLQLSALLTQLLVLLQRLNSQRRQPAHPVLSSRHARVEPILSFLNQSFAERITLEDLARRFHISPFYLCKRFRAETGFTVVEYLNQVRIREARRLLEKTDLSILEVSAQTGFNHVSHFGRLFKGATGRTPGAYRRNFLQSRAVRRV